MGKIANWILPALLILGAVLEGTFDLIKTVITDLGLAPAWVTVVQIVMVAIAVITAKLQAPSLKKAKLAKEGVHRKV